MIRKITAKNLEARFDAGTDVLDYFDTSRAKSWGGARPGAGRKSLGKIRKQVVLSPLAVRRLERSAKRRGLNFSTAIEAASAILQD